MGMCQANFVCVHWQLCRQSGFVILDGSGKIDKTRTNLPSWVNSLESCGGDMYCCEVSVGQTASSVITSLTAQHLSVQPGSSRLPSGGSRPSSQGSTFGGSISPSQSYGNAASPGISS